jgi:hypothetical protein
MQLGLNRKAKSLAENREVEDEIAVSVKLAENAICLQVVVKVSKRGSLKPNRRCYYHYTNNVIKA